MASQGLSTMPEFEISRLPDTHTAALRDGLCDGTWRYRGAAQWAARTHELSVHRDG